MGFYYGQSEPPQEKEPGGCRDVFILTRAVFGVLLWPMVILIGAVLGLVYVIYLFSVFWLLGLAALVLLAVAVFFYARWEQGHYHDRGLP